ncbi:MAG: CHAT domain-containing protein, partial [Acidobacteriales bacterium]|nr:CHAT domain-containing protein [Terriglobales bacterium]
DIQKDLLDDDTVLLQYALGRDRGFLWVVGRHRFESHVLPARAKVDRLVRKVRDLLVAPQPRATDTREAYLRRVEFASSAYWKPAHELANILLPAATGLVEKRLLISADGLLEYIPFSGLPLPAPPGGRSDTLAAKYEVVILPSASTIAALRSLPAAHANEQNIAIFADPVFESQDPRVERRDQRTIRPRPSSPSEFQLILRSAGFAGDQGTVPRLPGTRREAEAIRRSADSAHVALDFEANLQAVTGADLTNYQILHFATHGVLHSEHPELSGIILSLVDKSGRPQEGYLRFHHVYNLKLSADLVVLSACSSALGRQMAGEGVLSLSRAFLVAGSKRVVSSLWKVDDEVTSELMSIFYDEMLRHGKAPSAALRAAQMEIAKRKRWNFPYYWAAFVLQGDWR